MKLKIATIFYRKCQVNNQIHTDFSRGYDVRHFILPNQSILLNIDNFKKVL